MDSGQGGESSGAEAAPLCPALLPQKFVGEKEQLFTVNRPTGKSFRVNPTNVAGENYFNTIEGEGMDPNELEKALAELHQRSEIARQGGRPRALDEPHGGDRAAQSHPA